MWWVGRLGQCGLFDVLVVVVQVLVYQDCSGGQVDDQVDLYVLWVYVQFQVEFGVEWYVQVLVCEYGDEYWYVGVFQFVQCIG